MTPTQAKPRIIQMCAQVGLDHEDEIVEELERDGTASLILIPTFAWVDLATLAALHNLMSSGDTNGLPGWRAEVQENGKMGIEIVFSPE